MTLEWEGSSVQKGQHMEEMVLCLLHGSGRDGREGLCTGTMLTTRVWTRWLGRSLHGNYSIPFPVPQIERYMRLFFSCSVVSNSFAAPWTVACQASRSMGFSRQEHWSMLPFPSPGDLEPRDWTLRPLSPALSGGFFMAELPRKRQKGTRGWHILLLVR